MFDKLQKQLARRKRENSYRELKLSDNLVDFCSNDYLGISRLLNFENKEAIGSTGSRLLQGNYSLIETLEQESLEYEFKLIKAEKEAERQRIEAEGKAAEITSIATATAGGIREIAQAIESKGGIEAVNLRVAESYIKEFGNLAKENNTMIIPSDLSDIASMVAAATSVIKKS